MKKYKQCIKKNPAIKAVLTKVFGIDKSRSKAVCRTATKLKRKVVSLQSTIADEMVIGLFQFYIHLIHLCHFVSALSIFETISMYRHGQYGPDSSVF